MYNKKSLAKPTIKHNTMFATPAKNVSKTSLGNYTWAKGEVARQTIRQTTSHANEPSIVGQSSVGYARDITDFAKPTIRQTTLHSGRGHLGRQDGNIGYSRDCKDKAKPTIKQTT